MDLTASADAVIVAQTAPSTAALSLRRVAIDTYRENVAYLHRDCAIYRAEGFQALSKIEVRANGRHILASLNVVDDHSIVGCHELGLSEDAFLQLDRSMPEAQRLRRLFEYVAGRMHLSLDVVITDGRQPIGNGIGPVLEARDVMRVLENDPQAPNDLRQKSLRLAGRLIECNPDIRGGDGFAIARDILDSGRALSKMRSIIVAQGQKPFDHHSPQLGAMSFDIRARSSGVVTGIDNHQIARVARLAGAPKVIGAGVDLFHKLGETVNAGEALYRVYAGYPSDLEFARQACQKHSGYTLGDSSELPQVFVEF